MHTLKYVIALECLLEKMMHATGQDDYRRPSMAYFVPVTGWFVQERYCEWLCRSFKQKNSMRI
jgi:hypothetical protein